MGRATRLLALMALVGCAPPSLTGALQSHGYTALVPQAVPVPAGTILGLESMEPLRIGVLCSAESAVGASPGLVSTGQHPLARAVMRGPFVWTPEEAAPWLPGVSLEGVAQITVRLQNAAIVDLPAADARRALQASRTAACADALYSDDRIGASLVVSVLEADVTVDIAMAGGSEGRRDAVRRDVAAAWGLDVPVAGPLGAPRRVWGAIDAGELPYHGLPRRRGVVDDVLPANRIVTVEPEPDPDVEGTEDAAPHE